MIELAGQSGIVVAGDGDKGIAVEVVKVAGLGCTAQIPDAISDPNRDGSAFKYLFAEGGVAAEPLPDINITTLQVVIYPGGRKIEEFQFEAGFLGHLPGQLDKT